MNIYGICSFQSLVRGIMEQDVVVIWEIWNVKVRSLVRYGNLGVYVERTWDMTYCGN